MSAPPGRSRRAAVPAAVQDWSPTLQKSRIYERMLLDIVLGELAPDARLDEGELAVRYEAGLAGVREALGRLALEGLVVRRPRVGTAVAPLAAVDMREAEEARGLIEPSCAALAAERATEAEIEALSLIFDGAEKAVRAGDNRVLVAMDHRFHAAVAQAGHNGALQRIVKRLQMKSARYWLSTGEPAKPAEDLAAIDRHRLVVERIRARDVCGARQAMAATLAD